MGVCLAKLPHSCGTRDGLQVFANDDSGNVDGYCFSCSTYVENPYGDVKKQDDLPKPQRKTEEEIYEEIKEVSSYPVKDIISRKLRKDSLDYFNVKIGLDETDGQTPREIYYPYTKDDKVVAYKVELLSPKKFWTIGEMKECDLFGWEQAIKSDSDRIFITEGEKDAISLRRVLERYTKSEYQDRMPAVCSLPKGAGNAKQDISRHLKKIRQHFKRIVLVFDQDEPGQKALEEVSLICPEALSVSLPSKDANDCVMNGQSRKLFNAVTFEAVQPKNTRLVYTQDLHDAAREVAEFGELTWPWDHLNEVTRGIRYGETIYIGAGVKMGKSELLNALAAHFIKVHRVKVFMAKPEESNKKTYKLLAGKIVGDVFHDPKREFNFDKYDQAGEVLQDRVVMVNLYQHLGWETLKSDIVHAVNWGAKAIFIDPITNLINGIDAADANTKLQEISQELAAMAKDHNIAIFIFCHLKAPEGGIRSEARQRHYDKQEYMGFGSCPHELGGSVVSSQFAGSRAMMRSCNYMFGLEGNKDPNLDLKIRNMRNLKLLEDREFGETGNFPLYWDNRTTWFKEI